MKLWKKTLSSANNAYLFWILAIACFYLLATKGQLVFAWAFLAFTGVGYFYFHRSRKHLAMLIKQ